MDYLKGDGSILLRCCSFLFALLCLVSVTSPYAAEVSFAPSFDLTGAYNDNILFERTDEVADYFTILTPGATLAFSTEIGVIEASGHNDFYFYSSESDLDTQIQDYDIQSRSEFLERWTFKIGGSYRKDTTLDSELEETGIVLERDDRLRLSANTSLRFDINERTLTEVGFRYRDISYDDDAYTDYANNEFSYLFERKLRNQIDSLILFTTYTFREADTYESDTYRVNLGWRRKLEERLTVRLLGGYRHTEHYDIDRQRDTTDGGVFDISFGYNWERSRLFLGLERRLTASATGDDLEVDRIYMNFWHNLTERTRFDLNSRLLFTRNDGDLENNDGRYFLIQPSLTYNLTEVHRLSLAYRYTSDYDDEVDGDKTAAQNQIWLSLKLVWPQKW
jgi:hypothetical protein